MPSNTLYGGKLTDCMFRVVERDILENPEKTESEAYINIEEGIKKGLDIAENIEASADQIANVFIEMCKYARFDLHKAMHMIVDLTEDMPISFAELAFRVQTKVEMMDATLQ